LEPVPSVEGTGFVCEVTSHEDVVHVATLKQELRAQDALDHEAAGLVQPSGAGVATQYTQAQLACSAVSGFLDGSLDQPSTDTASSPVGVNRQPVELHHVLVRRELDRPAELRVTGDNTVSLGDKDVIGPSPLGEERAADRWCWGRGDIVGPGGVIQPSEDGIVCQLRSSNRYHWNRMPHMRWSTQGQLVSSG
jgi:hypothetical protein